MKFQKRNKKYGNQIYSLIGNASPKYRIINFNMKEREMSIIKALDIIGALETRPDGKLYYIIYLLVNYKNDLNMTCRCHIL